MTPLPLHEETDSPMPATVDPSPGTRSTTSSERGYQVAVFILVAVAIVLTTILVLDSTSQLRDAPSTGAAQENISPNASVPATTAAPPAQLSAVVSGQDIDVLASRIVNDSTALADLAEEAQALLIEKQEELRGTVTLYTTATRQVEQLNAQLERALRDSAEVKSLRTELAQALNLIDTADRRIVALEQQLAAAPASGIVVALQSSLDEADRMRAESTRKAADLESQLQGKVSSDLLDAANTELAALRKRLAEIQPENDKLRYEIQHLRAELDRTRLFVEKVEDLPAAAKLLFVELSKLETANPGELFVEYERIEKDLNVDVVDTISFATGSSQINLDKVEELRRSIRASGTDSYFLVVGYASKTGNFQSNKKLSAERATTIASVADANKDEGQGVNAVFLGQTDRFSADNVLSNQVCEIWEIRK